MSMPEFGNNQGVVVYLLSNVYIMQTSDLDSVKHGSIEVYNNYLAMSMRSTTSTFGHNIIRLYLKSALLLSYD